MALNAGTAGVGGLADEMYDALNGEFGINPDSDSQRQNACNVLAQVIVDHIVANAEVSTTVSVTSVSNVSTGVGVSGPGTGSGTGTIT